MAKARGTIGDSGDEVIPFANFDAEVFRDLYQRQTVRYRYEAKTDSSVKGGSWTDALPDAKARAPKVAAELEAQQNAEAGNSFGKISGVRVYREIVITEWDGQAEVGTLAVMRLPSYFNAILYFHDGHWAQIDKHVKTSSQTIFQDRDDDEDFLSYVRFWLCQGFGLPDFSFARELLAEARLEEGRDYD